MKLRALLFLALLSGIPAIPADAETDGVPGGTSSVASALKEVRDLPGNIANLSARVAYETMRGFGLMRGSWKDRRALESSLESFVALDDRSFERKVARGGAFDDSLFRTIAGILRAARLAEAGDVVAAEKILASFRTKGSQFESDLIKEAEVVLLGARAGWKRAAEYCLAPPETRPARIFTEAEIAYHCVLSATRAGEAEAAIRLAALLPDESEYRAYAWYAAASAAEDAERIEEAIRALEIVAAATLDRNRRLTADVLRQDATLDGYGPLRLLEQRALAALAFLHAEANDRVAANRALARMSPQSPWYAPALSALPENRLEEMQVALEDAESRPDPSLALLYARALLHAGRADLATAILSSLTARSKNLASEVAARPDASWIEKVLDVERRRLVAERARRARIAERMWVLVGAFGTAPESSGRRRPDMDLDFRRESERDRVLARYLENESVRRVIRNCLRATDTPSACSPKIGAAYGHLRSLEKENLRSVRYEIDRVLADAFVDQTVRQPSRQPDAEGAHR